MRVLPPAVRGAMWMVAAAIAWSAMYLLVRQVSDRFSSFEILFARNVVAVVLMLPLLARARVGRLRTGRLPMHMLRALLAYLGMLGLYFGIALVPLGDVVALSFTQPLFIVVIAALLLGERVERRRWAATLVGFSGILIIVRPQFGEVGPATLVVLASAATYAGSNVCIKALMSSDTPVQSVFYGNVLMLPLSVVPALLTWTPPGGLDLVWLVGVGVSGSLGMYFVSHAYRAADASAVVPYDFLRLPVTAAMAWLLFGETSGPWTWAGAVVIFGSSYALVLLETRSARRA
jgi:drug/metabolite transporter (DMT)-like permease